MLSENQLRRHRNRAGYTIGDARTVDLLRYAGWLTLEYFAPKEESQDYAERKRLQAERNAEVVRAAQDIGELPAVADPQRFPDRFGYRGVGHDGWVFNQTFHPTQTFRQSKDFYIF